MVMPDRATLCKISGDAYFAVTPGGKELTLMEAQFSAVRADNKDGSLVVSNAVLPKIRERDEIVIIRKNDVVVHFGLARQYQDSLAEFKANKSRRGGCRRTATIAT